MRMRIFRSLCLGALCALAAIGESQILQGDYSSASTTLREAIEKLENLLLRTPDDPDAQKWLRDAKAQLATANSSKGTDSIPPQ